MNTDPTTGWPRDFETELPLLQHGSIGDFTRYAKASRQPAAVRKLPVLSAPFDAARFDLSPGVPEYAGFGSIGLGRTVALTFRIQRGTDMLYWLANPADPDVWKMIDRWVGARRMVLAADFSGDRCVLLSRDFIEPPPMRELRRAMAIAEQFTPMFVAEVSRVILNGELQRSATTDIPSVPKLRHVQSCLVRTSTTGGVAVARSRESYPSENAVADAARELALHTANPKATRH